MTDAGCISMGRDFMHATQLEDGDVKKPNYSWNEFLTNDRLDFGVPDFLREGNFTVIQPWWNSDRTLQLKNRTPYNIKADVYYILQGVR